MANAITGEHLFAMAIIVGQNSSICFASGTMMISDPDPIRSFYLPLPPFRRYNLPNLNSIAATIELCQKDDLP